MFRQSLNQDLMSSYKCAFLDDHDIIQNIFFWILYKEEIWITDI